MSIPKTPYLQLIVPRLEEAIQRIQNCIWETEAVPLVVRAGEPTARFRNYDATALAKTRPITSYPHHWGNLYDQCWFAIDLTPADLRGSNFLFWKDQAEATLYVDGVPFGGFDLAHSYVKLPVPFESLAVEGICCQTGIWHPSATQVDEIGSRLDGAFLARRDEAAWHAYHDYRVLLDLSLYLARRDGYDPKDLTNSERFRRPLDRLNPQSRQIFHALDTIIDRFDVGGISAISEPLKETLLRFENNSHSMQITLTGHAHIDLVWLWPERIGESKAVHTFATVKRLHDQFPEFHFGYSQPASYEAVERRAPELMEEVRDAIQGRRWEPTGAMYVESDNQLSCGEGLLRSFTIGQEKFRQLTGAPSTVVWLPDVFGYTGCLPQIMQQTGVKYFFSAKLAWSNSTRFPFSSFRWRGNDGSEVVSHVLHSVLSNCYNTTTAIDEVVEPTLSHQQSDIHPEILLPVGYGDGGGGPTEEMCERVRRLAKIEGVPPTEWGRIDGFFERLGAHRSELPQWHGEIYLEFHRGVQTTQVELKQRFRALERALQYLEASHAIQRKGPIDEHYWKRMIFAQFHDYIPGSCVQEVYDEALPELRKLAQAALIAANAADVPTAFLNPHGYGLNHVYEADGKALQIELAPLSVTSAEAAREFAPQFTADRSQLSNGRVQAAFNERGEVVSLTIDGEFILIKGSLNQLTVFADHPVRFHAWEIDRQTISNPQSVRGVQKAPEISQTATDCSLRFSIQVTERSSAEVTYTLKANEPVLRVSYDIDWQDKATLLQADFPTDYFGKTARYGAPFGSSVRPQLASDIAADAQFEVPASRWALVSDEHEQSGLALIAEDRYGFGCHDGSMHVSLLRSAQLTQTRSNKAPRHLGYTHLHSDIGRHHLRIALAAADLSRPRAEQPAALADHLFTPPLAVNPASGIRGLLKIHGGDSLIPAWCKPAADGHGYILRLHETRGLRGAVTLELAEGWQASHSNCLETESTPLDSDNRLPFRPYDLLSVRITRGEQT